MASCNSLYVQKRIFQNHFSSIHETKNSYSDFQNSTEICSQFSISHLSNSLQVFATHTTPNQALALCPLLRAVQAAFRADI